MKCGWSPRGREKKITVGSSQVTIGRLLPFMEADSLSLLFHPPWYTSRRAWNERLSGGVSDESGHKAFANLVRLIGGRPERCLTSNLTLGVEGVPRDEIHRDQLTSC